MSPPHPAPAPAAAVRHRPGPPVGPLASLCPSHPLTPTRRAPARRGWRHTPVLPHPNPNTSSPMALLPAAVAAALPSGKKKAAAAAAAAAARAGAAPAAEADDKGGGNGGEAQVRKEKGCVGGMGSRTGAVVALKALSKAHLIRNQQAQ